MYIHSYISIVNPMDEIQNYVKPYKYHTIFILFMLHFKLGVLNVLNSSTALWITIVVRTLILYNV